MTSRIRKVQTTFQSGQIDAAAISRTDIDLFEYALKDGQNWRMTSTGGIERRYGTQFIADDINTDTVRMIPFEFDDDEQYLLLFKRDQFLVYRNDTLVQTVAFTDLDTDARVNHFTGTQSGDFLFICHKNFPIKEIQRTGVNTFVISNYSVDEDEYGVRQIGFAKAAEANTKLNVQAVNGDTISFPLTIGEKYRIQSNNPFFTNSYSVNEIQFKIIMSHETLTEGPVTLYFQTTNYVDSTAIKATLLFMSYEPTSGNTPGTLNWGEEMFSPVLGYPRAITFHSGRLWLAGLLSFPAHLMGSAVGAFWNFSVGTGEDNDAIIAPINSDRVNEIKHLSTGQHLQIFTDHSEFYISEDEGVPITPRTAAVRIATRHGIDNNAPIVLGDTTFFMQRRGTVMREFLWNSLNRGYTANPVSLLANDILSGVKSMALDYGGERGPEQYMYLVNNDGTMGIFHMLRSEEIKGFFPWVTDGVILEVACLDEDVYLFVKRVINGETVRWLEKVEKNIYLDASIEVDNGTSSTVFAGFDNYIGETVHVTSEDGDYYLGEFTVDSSGEIDLSDNDMTATKINAGLNYTCRAETLPINFQISTGDTDQLIKRIVSCFVRFKSSYNFDIDGKKFSPRYNLDEMSDPPKSFTGTKRVFMLGAGHDETVVVESSIPLPVNLLSIGVEVAF